MSLDWGNPNTYNYVDQEHNLMLCRNEEWNVTVGGGRYESIARSFIAYLCYGDERFIEGIESCWTKKQTRKKYKYVGRPYPVKADKLPPLVADHVAYSIFAFKYSGYSKESLKDFITHTKINYNPSFYLWAKALIGNKLDELLFYFYMIPKVKLVTLWNKFIYKITPFEDEVCQKGWIKVDNDLKPDRIKKLAKKLYPIEKLHMLAWQIYFMPQSKLKTKLQKMCLNITPRHNYVIKMILGSKENISKNKVDNYKPMTSYRWHTILNPWITDHDLSIITDEKLLQANVLDVDYVKTLYNTIWCPPIDKKIIN